MQHFQLQGGIYRAATLTLIVHSKVTGLGFTYSKILPRKLGGLSPSRCCWIPKLQSYPWNLRCKSSVLSWISSDIGWISSESSHLHNANDLKFMSKMISEMHWKASTEVHRWVKMDLHSRCSSCDFFNYDRFTNVKCNICVITILPNHKLRQMCI